MPTNKRPNGPISLKTIRGKAKLCCVTSDAFRNDVLILARSQGQKLQDYLLAALRDRVYADRKQSQTVEGQLHLALENMLQNRRTPPKVRGAIELLLSDYLPGKS